MTRERFTFRDLAAALKAAKEAGMSLKRIEIRADAVVLIPGEPEQQTELETDENPELAQALRNIEDGKI